MKQSQLYWRCRRGMLELDMLFISFLEDRYPTLCEEDQGLFVELLEEEDPDLFYWLVGDGEPEDGRFMRIVGLIKSHCKPLNR